MKTLHCEAPVPTKGKCEVQYATDPKRMTWRSLIANGLCMGKESPCVTGTCDVMCAYGRRYIKEKEKHAG